MKTLSEAIKKIKPEKISDILKHTGIKGSNEKILTSTILSIIGINSILSNLNDNELEIFKIIYSGNDGITFGEIEKKTKFTVPEIEKITETLSEKLLVYRIKNRKLLTNKMDKIYGITELSRIINIADYPTIKDHMDKIHRNLEKMNNEKVLLQKFQNDRYLKLLKYIISANCLVTLNEVKDLIPANELNRTLNELADNSIINIFYHITSKFIIYIAVNEKYASTLAELLDENIALEKIHNKYFSVINILNTFDVISTYGLFLTKQFNFRKIDRRRISDAMYILKNINGENLSQEFISQFSLYQLYKLKCLRLVKDIAAISLKNIRDEIETPGRLLIRFLKTLDSEDLGNNKFKPPFKMPSYKFICTILNSLYKLKEANKSYLRTTTLTGFFPGSGSNMEKVLQKIKNESENFNSSLNLLCLLGIIEIKDNLIKLSDIGLEVAAGILGHKLPKNKEKIRKSIYINPDFTIIIPVDELDSTALYNLLAYTEIDKYDFILHAVISKNSIIKAYKRGLPFKKFIDTLKLYSKNEIPQNLDFILTEWSNQTINLEISNVILLKSNNPSFISEMLHNKIKKGFIREIAPNYAVIDKEHIDEVIKIARKNDAVISLFEDSEGGDINPE